MTEGPPVAAWQPGEPLYQHPHYRPSGDGNYVRELFGLIYDEQTAVRVFLNNGPAWQVRCLHCLVGWGPEEGPRCWVCNKRSPTYEEALERSEAMKSMACTVAFRGGPRDGDCIRVEGARSHRDIVVPVGYSTAFYASAEEKPTASLPTARYTLSHFNYDTNYWIATYKGAS